MFSSFCATHHLTKASEFHEIAQAAIEAYYLPPYPGQPDLRKSGGINRKHHGGVHASTTALNINTMVALYRKYKPELLVRPDGTPFTAADLRLLKLAAIWHDSANMDEAKGNAKEHADNFRRDMEALGYSRKECEPYAMAIQEKDGKRGPGMIPDFKLDPKNIFQKLLHSGDSLDIIRVIGLNFDERYTDIFHDLRSCPGFHADLARTVEFHRAFLASLEQLPGSPEGRSLHQLHEFAPNCYESVRVEYERFMGALTEVKEEKKEELMDPALQQLDTAGLFYRSLTVKNIDTEFKTLEENKNVLVRLAGGAAPPESKDPLILRDHLTRELENHLKKLHLSGESIIHTPAGFKWRPSSLVLPKTPIRLFQGDIGILIDPNHPGTVAPFFYKQDVFSRETASGSFKYFEEKGPNKNKKSLQGAGDKIREQDKRRMGLLPDPKLNYFARKIIMHGEVLLTYHKEAVLGILVVEGKKAAQDALLLRKKLGIPLRKFYERTSDNRIVVVPDDEILERSIKEDPAPPTPASLVAPLLASLNASMSQPHAKPFLTISDYYKTELKLEDQKHETIEQSMTFNLTGLDESLKLQISTLLTQLKKNKEKWGEALYSIKVKTVSNQLVVLFTSHTAADPFVAVDPLVIDQTFNEGKACMSQLIHEVLGEIEKKLEPERVVGESKKSLPDPPNPYKHPFDRLFVFLSESMIGTIADIACSGISEKKPLQFIFKHPLESKITCTAQVNKAGIPTITLSDSDSPHPTSLEKESELVRSIAKRYYQIKTEELNKLLLSAPILHFLRSKGYPPMSVRLQVDALDRLSLEITLPLEVGKPLGLHTKNEIVKDLFLSAKTKDEPAKDRHIIRTPDIHRLDAMIRNIEKLQPTIRDTAEIQRVLAGEEKQAPHSLAGTGAFAASAPAPDPAPVPAPAPMPVPPSASSSAVSPVPPVTPSLSSSNSGSVSELQTPSPSPSPVIHVKSSTQPKL